MAELLRSLPPEWVDDSEVVRERRPGPCKADTHTPVLYSLLSNYTYHRRKSLTFNTHNKQTHHMH